MKNADQSPWRQLKWSLQKNNYILLKGHAKDWFCYQYKMSYKKIYAARTFKRKKERPTLLLAAAEDTYHIY